MKKTLLLGLTLLSGLFVNAQIADGSTAPDFTATDINGNVHKLSDYLAAGKTVILDISATWCGPCWNFHNSHVLDKFYKTYGEEGSDDVVVLFVEGDGQTTDADLHGTGNNTQGDWVTGSEYPIIDDASISQLYELEFFPTIMRICPDGKVKLMPNTTAGLSFNGIKSSINSACASLPEVANHAEIAASDIRTCGTGNGSVITSFTNYGTNPITAATVVLKENGAVIGTKPFTGTVAAYAGSGAITFDNVTVNASATHTVEIQDVNAVAPYSATISKKSVSTYASAESTNNIRLNVYTDNYPGEISVKIHNSLGEVVYTTPALVAGPGAEGAGGADANTTKAFDLVLPEGIDCYSFELLDAFGDGWSLGTTTHGIEVFNATGAIHHVLVGNFGSSYTEQNSLKTSGVLANPTIETEGFAVYPNPSTGIFNFSTPEAIDVTVLDITGKVIYTAKGIENGGSINLSSLQSGVYIAKIKSETAQRTEKLVIK